MGKDFLVYQAKSFYNAYIHLEKIYYTCENMMFYIPSLVNGAFSIELAIKAILSKNDIKYEKEHNLAVLFSLLPENIQHSIWEWVSRKTPEYSDEQKRNTELILISDAFKQLRYCFEDSSAVSFDSRFLSVFANATIGVMFSLGYNVDYERRPEEEVDAETIRMVDEGIERNRSDVYSKNKRYIEKKALKEK